MSAPKNLYELVQAAKALYADACRVVRDLIDGFRGPTGGPGPKP